MTGCSDDRKKQLFWCLILIAVLIRIGFTSRIPAWVRQNYVHDDQWVVSRAVSILNGDWLGAYDQYTLIKGCFAPLLLVFSYLSGFSYLELNTVLYCCACLFFIYSLQPVIKSRLARFLILLVLLFNPVSYGYSTWQRIYRNGLSQWQVLFIFGCIFRLYIHRMERWASLLPWAVFGGLVLWAFMNTREDGIWILPFVFCALGVTGFSFLFQRKGDKIPGKILKIAVLLIPILTVLVGNGVIGFVNKSYYGVSLRNDRDAGNYALVMRDLYLIKPEENDDALYSSPEYDDQHYNIYASTMEMAYKASPSMAMMRDNINAAIGRWDAADTGPKDGEPWGDHILFAIRDGVAASGYYHGNLAETEALYAQIHKELSEAFRTGVLEKRGLSLSAMSAPFQMRSLSKIIREYAHAFRSVLSFEDVQTRVTPSSESLWPDWLYEFERLSGNRAILQSDEKHTLTVKGWAFAKDDNTELHAALYISDGIRIADVPFVSGEDVYRYFENKGYDHRNAHLCRFNLRVENCSLQDVPILRFYDEKDTLVGELPLANAALQQITETDHLWYSIDSVTETALNRSEQDISAVQRYVDRANRVGKLYKEAGITVFVTALILYVLLTVSLWSRVKKKAIDPESVGVWLLSTGSLLSLLFVVFCVSYISATTFPAINHSYLSPAYIVNLIFCSVLFAYYICILIRNVSGRRRLPR